MACKNLSLTLNHNLIRYGRNKHNLARTEYFAGFAIERNLRFALDAHIDCKRVALAIVQLGYTIYNLSAFMDGSIQDCIDHLIVAENAERLKEAEL